MARTCINHKDVPSATMCHQCHHPICKSCSLVTPQGIFCSPECSILNREVKERLKEEKPREFGGFFTKAAAAFVLIVVGFMGIHIAATHGMPQLKRVDIIGLILKLASSQKEGPRK
jgi:hypothetical protein